MHLYMGNASGIEISGNTRMTLDFDCLAVLTADCSTESCGAWSLWYPQTFITHQQWWLSLLRFWLVWRYSRTPRHTHIDSLSNTDIISTHTLNLPKYSRFHFGSVSQLMSKHQIPDVLNIRNSLSCSYLFESLVPLETSVEQHRLISID